MDDFDLGLRPFNIVSLSYRKASQVGQAKGDLISEWNHLSIGKQNSAFSM